MRALALALGLWLFAASALAQAVEPSDADRAAALAMMQAGIQSAQDGDWEAARVAFSRAYALVPSTRVLMNLAGAQRHTDRLLEARASYEQWLHDATDRDAQYRPTIEQAMIELESVIPRVRVTVTGLAPGDAIDVDGTPYQAGDSVTLNPGEHTVSVRRDGTRVGFERVELTEGESREVAITVASAVTEPAPPPPSRSIFASHEEDEGISPWVWVGIGAGAAVVLAIIIGVAVGVSSNGSSAPAPDMGTFGPFHL